MANASVQVAELKVQDISIQNMAQSLSVILYTHFLINTHPFSSLLINVGVRDSTYVLDGCCITSLIYASRNTTPIRLIHRPCFALMHMLGFRFVPRIRDSRIRNSIFQSQIDYAALKPMIGGTLNIKQISPLGRYFASGRINRCGLSQRR